MTAAVRSAQPTDVDGICAFGDAHVRAHYAHLIGVAAAEQQVRLWWQPDSITPAVADGLVVVATVDAEAGAGEHIVAVGQRGRRGPDHVVHKLYVAPDQRGTGLGPRLLAALVGQLPAGTTRLHIEHFAANVRAGDFYEREGFTVQWVKPNALGKSGLDLVWRARELVTPSGC